MYIYYIRKGWFTNCSKYINGQTDCMHLGDILGIALAHSVWMVPGTVSIED